MKAEAVIIIIIIIILHKRGKGGTRDRGTINNDRIAATMYSLETWFVSGTYAWIPCIKEKIMMMIMITTIIIIIIIKCD